MKFSVTINRDEDGVWVVECPAIPGCVSQGGTKDEALENIQDAIYQCVQVQPSAAPLSSSIRATPACAPRYPPIAQNDVKTKPGFSARPARPGTCTTSWLLLRLSYRREFRRI